jgi:hypothetical protein
MALQSLPVSIRAALGLSYSKGMVSKMLKNEKLISSRIFGFAFAAAVSLPLAGCAGLESMFDEGHTAYTADEMYPIAARKPCGQEWPNLADDSTNHFSPNHGCAVHNNIAAMVADPTVLKKPKKLRRPLGSTNVTAINNMITNANQSTTTTNGSTTGGTTP